MQLKSINLKLSHHLMLMIATLLTLEVGLFGGSMWLINQAENEERKIQYRKDIISHTTEYINDIYGVCQVMGAYNTSKDKDSWTEGIQNSINQMDSTYRWLRHATADDEEQTKTLTRVHKRVEDTMNYYRELFDKPNALRSAVKDDAASPFRKSVDSLLAEMAHFNDEQIRQQSTSSEVERQLRQYVKNFLVSGMSINVLAVMLVAFNLTTTIVLRIDRLIDNVRRMHHKLPLLPEIGGADELTELDTAFHSMAKALWKEQDSLRESESRNRAFIESAPVGLMAIDHNGRIELANLPLAKMFGCSPRSLQGKHIVQLFSAGKLSQSEFWEQLRKNATGRMVELPAKPIEGDEFLSEIMLSKEAGHGQLVLASVTNIQEKSELTKLRQALLAMVSHDLRTPLTSVAGFLKMLLMEGFGQVNEEVKTQAQRAEQSTTRLIQLVNDLLDIEKMESGNLKVELAPCDLDVVFKQSFNSVAMFAQTKSIALNMPEPCGIELTADADRLVQVLVNLIANAVIASPEQSTVTVNYAIEPEVLKILVSDEGPGIAKEMQEIIFEKYQQLDRPDAKRTKGTGLGLAISKIIIEQHGGTIGLTSQLGNGATFWFTIPYTDD